MFCISTLGQKLVSQYSEDNTPLEAADCAMG